MRTLLPWSLLLAVLVVRPLHAGESSFELLPKGRPFRPTFADPREIRMALAVASDSRLTAAIGNYFSLLAYRPDDDDPTWRFHLGLEGAGYFTMRQADSRFPLETTDGLIGLYAEGARGPWQAQLRYTHVSAHLADGLAGTPIAYSRETLSLRGAYAPTADFQAYWGAHWLAHSVPRLPSLGLQGGAAWFLNFAMKPVIPFVAVDLQWRQESAVNPSLSAQLGIALNNPPEAFRSFRFFYAYYTGVDPRGQFYDRVITSHSLGIEMQI